MQDPQAERAAEDAAAVSETGHQYGRGQREADKGSNSPKVSCTDEPGGKNYLTAGRPGQKLTQRDQIRVRRIIEPPPSYDEFGSKVAQVRDWAAEGSNTQFEKR